MARTPLVTHNEPAHAPDIVSVNAREIMRAADAMELMVSDATKALAQQLGYGGSLNPIALEDGIAESKAMINQGLFTLGTRLLLLKEQCGHGEFMAALERQEVEERLARRVMQVTLKFSKRATSPVLTKLSKSALFELAVLDDEEIADLVEGKTVRGVTVDEVERMSIKDLRAALRKTRDNLDATQRLISDKNSELDNLKVKLQGKKSAPLEEVDVGEQLRVALLAQATTAERETRRLRPVLLALSEHSKASGISHEELILGAICQLERVIWEWREEFAFAKAKPTGDDIGDFFRASGLTSPEAIAADQAAFMAAKRAERDPRVIDFINGKPDAE